MPVHFLVFSVQAQALRLRGAQPVTPRKSLSTLGNGGSQARSVDFKGKKVSILAELIANFRLLSFRSLWNNLIARKLREKA